MADTKLTSLAELSVADLSDDVYVVDNTGPTSYRLGTDRLFGLLPSICEGRLTTESGVGVSTSDRTSQGTIYFTPWDGNRVCLYDGTRWAMYAFTERSLALTVTSGSNYDVFLYDNAGTLTLELSTAWTNATTRADGITTQDNVYVKTGALTRRWLGTLRASGSNVTADAAATRYVWNAYNRVNRHLSIGSSNSHAYATNTVRQWDGNAANQVAYVCGLAGPGAPVLIGGDTLPNADARVAQLGYAVDSTTAFDAAAAIRVAQQSTVAINRVVANSFGYHFIAALENAASGASVTFTDFTLTSWIEG